MAYCRRLFTMMGDGPEFSLKKGSLFYHFGEDSLTSGTLSLTVHDGRRRVC